MNNRQRQMNRNKKPVKKEPEKINKSSSGYMMDMFVNAMARTGMPAQNLMNTTDYELT